MAERKIQSAARLSEDIGDVLTAIRRLIAEDEALSAARERVMDDRPGDAHIIDEDSAEFLARRHGGNAALARQLARRRFGAAEAADNDDVWPLGPAANAPDAARPRPIMPETPPPGSDTPSGWGRVIRHADADEAIFTPRNDLARTLSEAVSSSRRDLGEAAEAEQGAAETLLETPTPEPTSPLRLDVARRVMPEPVPTSETADLADDIFADADHVLRFEASRRPADTPMPCDFEAIVEEDDFAEAFDWKARMRPELDAAPQPRSAFAAASGISHVADAEATVFDEEPEQIQPDGENFPARVVALTAPLAMGMGLGEFAWPLVEETAAVEAFSQDADTLDVAQAIAPAANDQIAAPTRAAEDIEAEEQSIRDLLREMIQEELQGEMGKRFSRNLRAVIRREIAAAIDEQFDRL